MKISIKLLTLLILPMLFIACSDHPGGIVDEETLLHYIKDKHHITPTTEKDESRYFTDYEVFGMETFPPEGRKGKQYAYYYCANKKYTKVQQHRDTSFHVYAVTETPTHSSIVGRMIIYQEGDSLEIEHKLAKEVDLETLGSPDELCDDTRKRFEEYSS